MDSKKHAQGGGNVVKCAICNDDAVVYCQNDRKNFCSKCDDVAHDRKAHEAGKALGMMREQHVRVPFTNSKQSRFGSCATHPKKENEYYDSFLGTGFCSLCAIDRAKRSKGDDGDSVMLDSAYS